MDSGNKAGSEEVSDFRNRVPVAEPGDELIWALWKAAHAASSFSWTSEAVTFVWFLSVAHLTLTSVSCTATSRPLCRKVFGPHPTFHIVYRNSTPGASTTSHQTLVATRFHAAPTLIAEWGTASKASSPARGVDGSDTVLNVGGSIPRQGPLVRGLTIAFNMSGQQTTFV